MTPDTLAAVAWDGQRWTLDDETADVQLMIDFDRWMLLRCRASGAGSGSRWRALTAAQAGAAWPLLRAALHARAPAPRGATRPAEHV
jgi:hypothetical protein